MWWASIFVLIPVVALVVVGILILVFQRATVDITFGVLILTFCVTLLVGAIVLVVSLKRATDLSQLQLDFLSKVSHEFRTPLTSIRLFTETLMGARPLTDDQRQQCLNMLDRDRAAEHDDGRLLDFGRMEAGKMVCIASRVGGSDRRRCGAPSEPIRLREQVSLSTSVAPICR